MQAHCVSALPGCIEAQVAQTGYTYLERAGFFGVGQPLVTTWPLPLPVGAKHAARRVVMIGGWAALLVPTCLEKGPLAPRPDFGHSTKLVRIALPTGNCSGTLGAKCTVKLFCIYWESLWVQPAVVSAARQQWIPFASSFSGWRREKVNVPLPGASLVPSAPAKAGTCAGPSLRLCWKKTGRFCGSAPPSSSCGTNGIPGYW